ncbi:MAG: hypothetical protein MSA56_03760, partial [Clostridium sp.]|nr:hypothetical protein [Clostridium sp.]
DEKHYCLNALFYIIPLHFIGNHINNCNKIEFLGCFLILRKQFFVRPACLLSRQAERSLRRRPDRKTTRMQVRYWQR